MTIDDVFETYGVDGVLADHMLRAAAIAHVIARRWTGPALDENALMRTLLIHDIGIAITRPNAPDAAREIAAAAAGDKRQATQHLAERLGLSDYERTILGRISLRFAPETLRSGDDTLKVLAYVDHRQNEGGVITLAEGMAGDGGFYRQPEVAEAVAALLEIERQIEGHYASDLHALDTTEIAHAMQSLRASNLFDAAP